MRTLPQGTHVISPRGRLGRLWHAFWHQWVILAAYWRAAWCGKWSEPKETKPATKKERRKAQKEYDRLSK